MEKSFFNFFRKNNAVPAPELTQEIIQAPSPKAEQIVLPPHPFTDILQELLKDIPDDQEMYKYQLVSYVSRRLNERETPQHTSPFNKDMNSQK